MNPRALPAVRAALLLGLMALVGCNDRRFARNPPPSAVRGNSAPLRPLAIPSTPSTAPGAAKGMDESAPLIPPPPELVALNGTRSQVPAVTIPEAPKQAVDLVEAPAPHPDAGRLQVAAPASNDRLAEVRRIHKEAESRCTKIDCFEARLTRREYLNGKNGELEVIRFQFRKQPLSIHMKWIGAEGQGREVVYVDGRHEGKIHILTARGDMFPLSPVTRLALAPDSELVRSKSRHCIRDAGFDSSVRQLGQLLAAVRKNPALENRVAYRGLVERPEYRTKMEAVETVIAPGEEDLLPHGGRRTTYFDPTSGSPSQGLPVIVSTRDQAGHEVEYYCFDRLLFPIVLDDADFDPDRLFRR